MIRFKKDKFMDYIKEHYTYDIATIRMINSLIDYGIKHHSSSVNQLSYFISDILEEFSFETVNQFELFDKQDLYTVEIIETRSLQKTVKATSKEHALKLVENKYYDDEFDFENSSYFDPHFEIVETDQ